jgi:hypothetical protein
VSPMAGDLLDGTHKVSFPTTIWNRTFHEATTPFRIDFY